MSDANDAVQNHPSFDSPPTDPFEALVASYYQYRGYVTSSAKWFWVWGSDKKQRGYQDIDLMAINETEIIIVSVSGSLDDKVRYVRGGGLNQGLLDKHLEFFERVDLYLNNVPQYQWLLKERDRKRVIAYSNGIGLAQRLENDAEWGKHGIQLLYSGTIFDELKTFIENPETNTRTNNQIVKMFQIMRMIERDKEKLD